MPQILHSIRILSGVSTANFLVRFHHYLVAFAITTFLATFIDEVSIGFALAAASAVIAASLFVSPHLFMRFGTKSVLIFLGLAGILSTVGLSVSGHAVFALAMFAIQGVVAYNIMLGLDLLLESRSVNDETGRLRGIYLVISNLAVLVSVISLSRILDRGGYDDVFIIAAAFLIPFTIMAAILLPKMSSLSQAKRSPFVATVQRMVSRPQILIISGLHFLVLLFFTWTIYYVPLYLVNHIGFSWEIAGMLITLSVLPYVLFEFPLGRIADLYLGEKEITIVGFVLMSVATATLSFLSDSSLFMWASIIFLGNAGGAAIEVMTETHFFKLVSVEDGDMIGVFRMLRPLSAIVGPILASLALLAVPFYLLFSFFGAFMILAIPLLAMMKDSR